MSGDVMARGAGQTDQGDLGVAVAHAAVQGIQRRHVRIRQLEVEDVNVCLSALSCRPETQ